MISKRYSVGDKVRPMGGGIVEPTGTVVFVVVNTSNVKKPYIGVKYPGDEMPVCYFDEELVDGRK
jgi:hypothetical protein